MERFFNKTKQIIFSQQKGMFSSAMVLSLMIIVSRVFGFLRYRILAGYFAKEELDIFFASFRIPDLIFEILITGALTSSLIPIIVKYQKNKKELEENVSSIFNIISLCLVVFVVVLFFLLDKIMPVITPGFDKQKIQQVVFYSQILLVGQLPFLVIGNFITGIAQANKVFILTAVAPVVYNIAIILSTLVFYSQFHLMAPVIGVIIGALLFFLVQLPLLSNLKFSISVLIKITSGVKEFFKMIGPRIMTVLVNQLDATIDLTLTTLIGSGAYTVFYLAQHLQLLPVSVIGIAYGQASLPYLSEIYQQKNMDKFKKVIVDSILSLLFFTIPIMGFFIFARTPLVRLFFGGQKFDWEATVQTATTLSYFALSLPFHSAYYFITRCFYAFLDTKTPFIVSVGTIILNTALSIYFIIYLKLSVTALAISFSIAAILNVLILILLLAKRLKGLYFRALTVESVKITTSMFISSFVSYYMIKLLDGLVFDTSRTINVFLLLLTSGIVYVLLYLFLSWFFNVREMYMVTKLLLKAKEYRKKFVELYTSYE